MTPTWRDEALAELRPSAEEDRQVRAIADRLCLRVETVIEEHGWTAKARIEGSVAKGTYLHGNADADVFVAFPTEVDRAELTERTRVLARVLDDPVIAYAEHPYVQGTWEGHPAEIVPCYDVASPTELRSAVDRTRFHTDHVLAHLTATQHDDVRLLKAFLHAAEAYGAEESVRGFSGYLCELLVIEHGDFESVLAWLAAGPASDDPHHPLHVTDPVDPDRNVAAAVATGTLRTVVEAARAFDASPDARFFRPPPAPRLARERAAALVDEQGLALLALEVPIEDEPLLDPVHAQLRRAERLTCDALERDQVPVVSSALHVERDENGHPRRGCVLIACEAAPLSRPKQHMGPPTTATSHADRFRERWTDAQDAASGVREVDGRLTVEVVRTATTLSAIVEPALAEARAGKVLDRAARKGRLVVHEGKAALEAAPEELLARTLDPTPPWERQAAP